ncbi:MAG: TlpA family protein disulfide reductase [Magnetospirillum sp. WYHS-4]
MRKTLIAFLFAVSFTGIASAGQPLHPVPGTPAAPDFALPDLDGKDWRLSAFKGRVAIVNFWATWCPPCRTEIPSMQRAWDKLKDHGVVMLAVHVGGNMDKIWTFVGDHGVRFPVLVDKDSRVANAWPMKGLPSTFVVDPQGRIVLQAIGGREWDDPEILKTLLDLRSAK